MDITVRPLYRSSQEALYTIAEIGWDSCLENISDFSATKPKYTPAFIQAAQDAITDAQNLGTSKARYAPTRVAYTPIQPLADACLDLFHLLDIYIDDSFPDNIPAMHAAAGGGFYAKAAHNNWLSLRDLNSAALQFITNNTAALTTLPDGITPNMPITFPKQYSTAVDAFNLQFVTYVHDDQSDPGLTAAKIKANNAVYASLTSMFKDGAAIYRRNPAMKTLFTFDDILAHIVGPGTTGVRFQAVDSVSLLPIPGVIITAQPGATTATTGTDGIIEVPLSENAYALSFVVPTGYAPVPNQTIKTNTGIMHRKKLILTKM